MPVARSVEEHGVTTVGFDTGHNGEMTFALSPC